MTYGIIARHGLPGRERVNGISISLIIAHYSVDDFERGLLVDTIRAARKQAYDGELEIIVTDDGSTWSRPMAPLQEDIVVFKRDQIRDTRLLKDLDIDLFVRKNQNDRFNKAELWNLAARMAKFEKLVFLDDDHPFLYHRSLERFDSLLNAYEFVVGRVINNDGKSRLFRTRMVQGTTFGMRKTLLREIGGFGEYTASWGQGDDSDLFWKVYSKLFMDRKEPKRACYASYVVTADKHKSASRWKKYCIEKDMFIREFTAKHGADPFDNPSRIKKGWMVHADSRSRWNDMVLELTRVPIKGRNWFKKVFPGRGEKP